MSDHAPLSDARQKLLRKYLRGTFAQPARELAIPRRPTQGPIPLSYPQEQVWLHAQLAPNFPLYNEAVTIHHSGPLDIAALECAFNEILRRHEAWRTSFPTMDGVPVQKVCSELKVSLPVTDLREVARDGREAEAVRLATEDATEPLSLTDVPLFRVRLIRLGDEEYRLYLVLHHIIFDGVAIYSVFLPELAALYAAFSAGKPSPLPDPEVQYPDYAAWQRQSPEPDFARHLEYWRQQLLPELPALELPTDRSRPPVQTFRGSMYPFALSRELTSSLKAMSKNAGVTLFQALLAAFAALLARYCGENTFAIGSVTSGRDRPQTRALLGYFLNTVVLRADLCGNPSFTQLMRRMRDVTLGALEHDCVPFSSLIHDFSPSRDLSRNPLFEVAFSLEPPMPDVAPEWRLTQMDVDTGATKYDLHLELDERSEGVLARFHFSTDLFNRETIARMTVHWIRLVEAAVANPELCISDLPLITDCEHRKILEWNATKVEYPRQKSVHQLFEEQVEKTPEGVAVEFDNSSLTYGELNRRANQLAHYLRHLGVKADDRVAVCMERGFEMIIALLAALKAGGAYVPLDPAYPPERLRYMLEDSEPVAVLTQGDLLGLLAKASPRVPLFDLKHGSSLWRDHPESNPDGQSLGLNAQHLAYLIYTSGSTGDPKGVMVSHQNVVSSTFARTLRYGEFGRFLLVSPIWFDSSVAGIFGTLTNAGTLLIATRDMLQDPARLNQYIQRGQVDTLLCVPSLYQQLLSYSATLADESRLGRVIVAGEPCPPTLVQESKRKRPQVVLFNEYGPTEGTVWASTYQIETTDHPSVPIGRPIANARIYILDAQRQPVPLGVSGELYIAGSGVARGYWKRPELTSERFLEDPFTHEASARMYRTGDLGRWRDDGNIEFLGRNDFQVKIRGFRIELGEIEARLMEHPAVRDAAVIAREDTAGDKRLVAYYTTTDQNEAAVGNETLRAHLSVRLPEYMIPAAYVRLERLPLTGNGKLDRKALPAPGTASYVVHGCEPPVGEIEEMLAGMWAELLKLEHVGRHDNFFEVGGHSLLAVTLVERMRQSGLQVDVRALFATPTVAGLASAVDPEAHGIEVPANRILSDSKAVTPEMLPLVDLSAEEIEHVLASVSGGAGNVQDIYPLAPLQEGILFHHLMQGEADPYVLGTEMSFASRAQLDAYVGALQAVVDRHDILRTAVIWEGVREPVQVVWRKAAVPIEEVELDPAAGDPAQQLYARYDPRHYRIEVREAPLLRLYIAHDRAQERWLMMQLQHHLTIDHSTLEVMQEEIEAHLLGKADGLPRPLPFRNLVAQARLGVSREKHEAYFRALLGDVAEPTAPFGLLNVRGDGTGIEESRLEVEEDLARRVRQRARKLGVSVASLFHVAWALVLARVSGRQDVVFGTVVFGRMQGGEGADRVLGLFINTLPVRIRAGLEGVEESVRRAQLQLAELLRHEHASLALAQRSSNVPAPTPLFSALLNYRHSSVPRQARSNESKRAWEGMRILYGEERTNYPATLSVDDLGGGFRLTAQVQSPIEPTRMCEYMHTALASLVAALETAPARQMRCLEILPQPERQQVLYNWNATEMEYPGQRCVHQLFEEQVDKTPERVAVECENAALSYSQLNRRANQLAHNLKDLGVKPDDRVAICMERSLGMIIALLAVLKAGAAYVPLDPAHPAERLRFMVEDSAPVALLTEGHLKGLCGELSARLSVLDVSEGSSWRQQSASNPDSGSMGLTSENLAYVMYTSGSTGQPKGVMIEHRSVVNRLIWMQNSYRLGADDSVLQKTPFGFDVSVWEFFWPLLSGAKLVMARPEGHKDPDYLVSTIEQKRITTLHFVPSMLQVFLEHSQNMSKGQLRRVVCSGEALSSVLVRRFYQQLPNVSLYNLYGPTEATVDVTAWVCPSRTPPDSIPIGRPIANTRMYILDEYLEPVPVGVIGELYIGGVGVARGYLNRPELTAERFVKDPFVADTRARMYRTGDLGRWLDDGNIEFLGRNDFQVKMRGFRIELGEIEARLMEHPAVRQAVAILDSQSGDGRIVAYVVAEPTQLPDVSRLRGFVEQTLPDYMVPSRFVSLDWMPLTTNGKVDRRALPAPPQTLAVATLEVPRDEVERALVEIFEAVLGLHPVGVSDDFFRLGGHSLIAVQVIARVRKFFSVELPVRSVFEKPTVAGLAEDIRRARAAGEKMRTPMLHPRPRALTAASREEVLAQLDTLSELDAQTLLQRVLDEKQSV